MDTKAVPFELTALKAAVGANGWEFSGYASTFGNVDNGGDVVMRGAFENTLAARKRRPLLWQHDIREPIGLELSLTPDDKGLLGTWHLLDTTRGTDAHKLLAAGAIDSLSIGYLPDDFDYDDAGVRRLKSLSLLECSVVSLPMNEEALITRVKSLLDASYKAEWDTAYVNSLPDSAFALILPGGKKDDEGKTTPRDLRKLPHHDKSSSLDMPHLRNALSRCPQMSGCSDEQRAKAQAHLDRHAKAEGIGKALAAHLDDLPLEAMCKSVAAILTSGVEEAEALNDRRAAEQRKLSVAHHDALEALLGELKGHAERIQRLLGSTQAEADGGDLKLRLELARRRMARLAYA